MKYEDCPPTWEGILPVMYRAILNPDATEKVKDDIYNELRRMSRLADEQVLLINSKKKGKE